MNTPAATKNGSARKGNESEDDQHTLADDHHRQVGAEGDGGDRGNRHADGDRHTDGQQQEEDNDEIGRGRSFEALGGGVQWRRRLLVAAPALQ